MRAAPAKVPRKRAVQPRLPRKVQELARDLERQHEELEMQHQVLIDSQQELELSRERYVDFYDSAPVCFVTLTRTGLVSDVNLPAARKLATSRRQLLGMPFMNLLAKAERRPFLEHLSRCRRHRDPGQSLAIEVELLGRPGEPACFVEVISAAPSARLKDGAIFHSVFLDITERRRLRELRADSERDLRAARTEADRANQAKDDFLAALSHELRTPLNPVLLLASEAAEDRTIAAHIRAKFELIRRNTELEARLIDDMLDLTGITRGKLILEKRPLQIHATLLETLAIIRPEIDHKQIQVEAVLAAPRDLVLGDPVRLQQIFWNVLKNAVKFTPAGGKVTVATMLERKETLVIAITDTGIGLAAAEPAHIFDAFTQGEHAAPGGSRSFGGLGLGLAISRKLVEGHHGTIEAFSPGPGRGSTFTVRLPLAPASLAAPGRPEPAPEAAGSSTGVRILLVEDHEPTRTTLTHLLRRRHYLVTEAGSAEQAVILAAAETFDLLITDIGLPGASGYDLLRDLPRFSPIKSIALTGYGMETDMARSQAAGFDVHLTKPISFQALAAAVASLFPVPAA